ncbi:hypothetical protein L4X63_07335 [Geomonas sp. Red32]|uniref:hypothetical protein n=1 Tax=Geomonas sp. Red32 TaxID=2912856 RepID=UPI00202D077F|nr:hypothetical protein [Geomonas sp. Red32]MCM0081399.1 hypothetical protein [Geomonas sp. Red32]
MNRLAFRTRAPIESSASSPSTVGFTIDPIPGKTNCYTLVVKGFLSPGWTGRLTAALAQHRISIERGEAAKVSQSAWYSSFELKASPFASDPLTLDYAALASRELPSDRAVASISLLKFSSYRDEDSLFMEIKGVDRLGFLGDLLDYFSMRCLFPVKMTIETVGNTAVDRFWLRGVGGSRPSDAIADAIRENLEKLLVATA